MRFAEVSARCERTLPRQSTEMRRGVKRSQACGVEWYSQKGAGMNRLRLPYWNVSARPKCIELVPVLR